MNIKIHTDDVEETAVAQIEKIKKHPAFQDAKIRIMPDVHAGVGCVIGFTSTLTDLVVPNIIGVDIGCGVKAAKVGKIDHLLRDPVIHLDGVKLESDLFKCLDQFIRKNIPSGFHIRENKDLYRGYMLGVVNVVSFEAIANNTDQDAGRVLKSIGTLGGGNHFIELDIDEEDNYWLVVHSGSRNFGHKIASFFQEKSTVPDGFSKQEGYIRGDIKDDYLTAMEVAQTYASVNRDVIIAQIMNDFFKIEETEIVESIHNYINFDDGIIRKGAISAHKDEQVIIPWNMRDGIIIGKGKGNEDWNYSAPHGAGRVMGRKQAKKILTLDEFKDTMKDVWSSCINEGTLDEAPMAYKDSKKIEDLLSDTVEITHRLKPVYNFKSEETRKRRR